MELIIGKNERERLAREKRVAELIAQLRADYPKASKTKICQTVGEAMNLTWTSVYRIAQRINLEF